MSEILARVFGIYFLAIGIAFLLFPERFKLIHQQVMKDQNWLFMGGLLGLLIGAVVVSIHNIWVWSWPVIITILGWWSLLKGFALIIYPDFAKWFAFMQNRSLWFYRIVSLVYVLLGCFLIYKGLEH